MCICVYVCVCVCVSGSQNELNILSPLQIFDRQSGDPLPQRLSSPPSNSISSKKQVRWDPDLCRVQYFDPLPPISDDEEDADEGSADNGSKRSFKRKCKDGWGTFWRQPERLDDDVFPMPFIEAMICLLCRLRLNACNCLYS